MAIYEAQTMNQAWLTHPVYKLIIAEHQTDEYVSFRDSFTSPWLLEDSALWVGRGSNELYVPLL